MKIETSSSVTTENLAAIQEKMREAAKQANSKKFFTGDEKLEIATGASFPSIKNISKIAPLGDPGLCGLGYALARQACDGDPVCEAIAAIAYQKCLES